MATNESLIKDMCTDDFNKFLFRFKIHNLDEFLGNGAQNIKDMCEYVTDHADEDGIYNALVHYGLIEG